MSGKRTRSFKCAVHHRDREVCSENDFHLVLEEPPLFQRMLHVIALELLPDERDRKYYADRYTCCPPPWFIVFITVIELSLFAFHAISMRTAGLLGGSIPICLSTSTSYSLLIYRPDKRYELWRFVTYMFLHDGWCHLGFNLLIQLLLGLPLEMVHGSARLASIYFSGVLAGSLGTSIIDPEVCLVGASGGAYALLAAHLANVMINYHQMRYGVLRLAVILFFASCDVGFAIYTRYAEDYPAVSFIAHLSGALSGLTIGLLVLKNFEQKLHEQLLWWIALGIYTACIIFAIIFNIINSAVMQSLKVEQIYVTETFYNGFQV
uniref:rhomboid protease n=1 Tax=Glossina palpalis gambiensis TaxID=67801 RepID=A0A1B0AVN2_9MUSC